MVLLPPDMLPVEDERQIRRLLGAYCHGFAHGLPEEWVALFTPDGIFEKVNPSHGGLDTPAEHVQGHEALLAMTLGRRARFEGRVRHQHSDILLSAGATPDQALGHSLILVTDWRSGAGRLAGLGECHSQFRRTEFGWRIVRLRLNTLPGPQTPHG